MLRRMSFMIVMLSVLMLSAGTLLAQPGGAGGAGGAGGRGGAAGGAGGRGGRGFNPQAQLDQMKADLGASDEEWTVLLPKIQKVQTAMQEAQSGGRGGRGGGRGGRGGNQPGGAPAANNAVAQALADLQQTLQNTNAPAEQISQKLQVLRDARARAQANLAAARKELKDLLTARQEAVLVANSYGGGSLLE